MKRTSTDNLNIFLGCLAVLVAPNRATAEGLQDKMTRQANQQALDAGQRLIDVQTRQAYQAPGNAQDVQYPNISPSTTFDTSGYAALFQAAAQEEADKAAQKAVRRSLILKRFETDKSPAFQAYMKQHCDQAALNRKYSIVGYAVSGAGIAIMLGGLLAYTSMGSSSDNTSNVADETKQSSKRSSVLIGTLISGAVLGGAGLFVKPLLGKEAYLHAEDCN